MKLRILYSFYALFLSLYLCSQHHLKDSLWSAYKTSTSDTQRVNTLTKLFYAFSTNDTDSALKIAREALRYSFQVKYNLGKSSAYNNIGTIFYFKGNNTAALTNFMSALKILESNKPLPGEEKFYKKQISTSLNNLGTIYQRQRQYAKAETYFLKSIQADSMLGNKMDMAHCYNNIGTIKEETGKYDEAILNYEMSLRLKKEMNDTLGFPSTLINMGVVRMNQSKFKDAELYFTKALGMAVRQNNKQDEALALINLGDMFYLMKNYKGSLSYYLNGIEVCKAQNYHQFLSYAYNSLSLSYYKMNDFKGAYEVNQTYMKLRDSMYSKENARVLNEMQTKYDTESKEKEIKILLSDKEIKDLELNRKRILIYVFIGGSALLIVIVIIAILAFRQKQKANLELDEKNKKIEQAYKIVEEKQKEILDSINYARRIQYTLLAHGDFLKQQLNHFFVYFKPKDIVSGDFYWATQHGQKFYLAVCDSTGHGVPGAFMSLLSIGFLSEAINEKRIESPNEVFDFVRQRLTDNISKEGQKDGFDGVLLCIDREDYKITYAAANNSPVIIRENEVIIQESDRMPVGIGERKDPFRCFNLEYRKGDTLYLYTDGYADQFGGPRGKKFKYKQLNELLQQNSSKAMEEQYSIIKETFENWKGELEQIDDVTIVGIKI